MQFINLYSKNKSLYACSKARIILYEKNEYIIIVPLLYCIITQNSCWRYYVDKASKVRDVADCDLFVMLVNTEKEGIAFSTVNYFSLILVGSALAIELWRV